MNVLIASQKQLIKEERWDFDYHSPPELILEFPQDSLKPVIEVAEIVKEKRDPTLMPDSVFQYIDISSVDVEVGEIARTQELTGGEAPSRARKLVRGYDIIISTCRPTRGAIAVVPEELHGEICSTGFSVIRARDGVNPFYLHYAIRLQSTMEQFRKFSTGSSYPAILDSDVAKTRIPVPDIVDQNEIVKSLRVALQTRKEIMERANNDWFKENNRVLAALRENSFRYLSLNPFPSIEVLWHHDEIKKRVVALPSLDGETSGDLELDFDDPKLEIEKASQDKGTNPL